MPNRLLTLSRTGAVGIWKFLWKHKYWIVLALVLIPTIIGSIQEAKATNNPAYPLIQLGLHLSNADNLLYNLVEDLKEDPLAVIGVEKPSSGVYKNTVYYWHLFKLIWKIFGLFWLITFPFVLIYKIVRTRQTSEPAKNIKKTLIYGVLFIFIINLLTIIYNLISGTGVYQLPEGTGIEKKMWLIIVATLPFHGVVNLGLYLISLL